jgi:DNA-binding IclR family transcriptional regulator
MDAGGGAVQSVDRALRILELLASQGVLGVTEIAGLLSVHKSTASRLLATLEAHGLAEQVPDRGRYRLGVGVLRLAGATRARLDLVQESRPVTHLLAAELGETVNVVILVGRETLYLDQVSGTSALQIHNWVGARNPVHATANGRVLLAGLEPGERDALLADLLGPAGELPRLTDRTMTAPDTLASALAEVTDRGYAIARDELEIGLTAVAAPIRGVDGGVIASISASGPTFRLADRLDSVARAVVAAAAEVSRRMGFHGSDPADVTIR